MSTVVVSGIAQEEYRAETLTPSEKLILFCIALAKSNGIKKLTPKEISVSTGLQIHYVRSLLDGLSSAKKVNYIMTEQKTKEVIIEQQTTPKEVNEVSSHAYSMMSTTDRIFYHFSKNRSRFVKIGEIAELSQTTWGSTQSIINRAYKIGWLEREQYLAHNNHTAPNLVGKGCFKTRYRLKDSITSFSGMYYLYRKKMNNSKLLLEKC